MCNYLKKESNICTILNNNCPYMFFCNNKKEWVPLRNMPINCKIKKRAEIPAGYYKVCFEKHGNLYIDINGHIQIIKNPFDIVPQYVKVIKNNNKWEII